VTVSPHQALRRSESNAKQMVELIFSISKMMAVSSF